MNVVHMNSDAFEEEANRCAGEVLALEIVPWDEVPGVSQYVEVSSAQPVRYAVTRKRAASSPLRFLYPLGTSQLVTGDGAHSAYSYDEEEEEFMYNDVAEPNSLDAGGYCDDDEQMELVSKRIGDNITFGRDTGDSVDEMYRILEKKAYSLDEDYVEACKVIQSVEQPFYHDNRRYRAQKAADRSVRGCLGVSCSSCRLKFFWPPDTLKMHITWLHVPGNGIEPHLRCPICGCFSPTDIS
ncbi:unnamed protein product [Toxocara canis]|uniref:C2H2-type domain-containing protein n=1 Tax=Toxocara canis TaxID=6265 RepID=A0A183UEK2_TOXCA|nr:unnamed protein product [Toxocara canis]